MSVSDIACVAPLEDAIASPDGTKVCAAEVTRRGKLGGDVVKTSLTVDSRGA